MRLHLHQCAGCERSQRRIRSIDLIAEHPHVTGPNTPLLAALKTQHREGRMLGKNLRGGRIHLKLAAMAATTVVIIRQMAVATQRSSSPARLTPVSLINSRPPSITFDGYHNVKCPVTANIRDLLDTLQAKRGRFMLGSAVDLRERWERHRRALRDKIHHNAPLQQAWNLYGRRILNSRSWSTSQNRPARCGTAVD